MTCPLGSLPDSNRTQCEDIPEVYLRADSGWAIGVMSFSSVGILLTSLVRPATFSVSFPKESRIHTQHSFISYLLINNSGRRFRHRRRRLPCFMNKCLQCAVLEFQKKSSRWFSYRISRDMSLITLSKQTRTEKPSLDGGQTQSFILRTVKSSIIHE